jgi:nucleotide-binding universal stress UspA family protein
MLNSVLLHLDGADQAQPVIRLGVALARQTAARVRGLTLLDTRRAEAASNSETAVYAVMEHTRQALAERLQETVRAELSQACLQAGLNFDVRRSSGDPLQVLSLESRFHDLVVTSVPAEMDRGKTISDWSRRDLARLLNRGVQPLLVVHAQQRAVSRVLLTYDGSEASGRAIRSFLSQGICTDAEHRLLAVGETDEAARQSLREMADYCLARRRQLETGCISGKLRRVLLPYAKKWNADLIVVGIANGNHWVRWIMGHPALEVLKKLSCGLYTAS